MNVILVVFLFLLLVVFLVFLLVIVVLVAINLFLLLPVLAICAFLVVFVLAHRPLRGAVGRAGILIGVIVLVIVADAALAIGLYVLADPVALLLFVARQVGWRRVERLVFRVGVASV